MTEERLKHLELDAKSYLTGEDFGSAPENLPYLAILQLIAEVRRLQAHIKKTDATHVEALEAWAKHGMDNVALRDLLGEAREAIACLLRSENDPLIKHIDAVLGVA